MKTMKQLLVILLAVSLIFSIGCTKKSGSDKVTLGETNNGVYTNDFFNLKINVPQDWYSPTKEEMDQIANVGNEAVAGDDEELKNQLDLAKEKTLNLLFVFKHPLDFLGGVNYNFMCIAENLGIAGISVKTGDAYLDAAKELMKNAGLPYEFSEYGTADIGGKSFTTMDAVVNLGDLTLTQRYHTAIIKGYAMNFVLSFTTEEEYNELKTILDSVKL